MTLNLDPEPYALDRFVVKWDDGDSKDKEKAASEVDVALTDVDVSAESICLP